MSEKAKEKKKKKPGKKTEKKSGKRSGNNSVEPGSVKSLFICSAVIAAIGVAVFSFHSALPWLSPGKFLSAAGAGLVTGFSGNPFMLDTIYDTAVKAGMPKNILAAFPTGVFRAYFSREFYLFVMCGLLGAVTLWDAIKTVRIRYEPLILTPVLAVFAMTFAWWSKQTSALFTSLFMGVADSPYFAGGIMAVLMLLTAADWASKGEERGRRWAWSLAAAPAIGFWTGYITESWEPFLAVLLIFTYKSLIKEGIAGTIAAVPLVAMPVLAAKVFYSAGAGGMKAMLPAADKGIDWPAAFLSVLVMAAFHLWVFKLRPFLPQAVVRNIFFILFIVFTLLSVFRV